MALLPRRRRERGGETPARFRTAMDDLITRFFSDWEADHPFETGTFLPATDVVETPEEIQVKAEIPGMKPEDLDISITGDTLTLRGEKKEEKEQKEENYLQRESYYGSFRRTVPLPDYADREKVNAEYKDGVLTVHVGKTREGKEKQVKVDVK